MPKTKQIQEAVKNQCIGLHIGGHTIRGIGRTLSLPPSTVSFIVRRWKKTGSTGNLLRSGRPKKVSPRGARYLKKIVKQTRRNTLRSITEGYNDSKKIKVSSKTISRELHKMGFWARKPCKKPLVSAANKKKRLSFYESHKNWGLNQWKNIVFSDESKFNLFDADGRVKVWRTKEERYLPECTTETIRGGGGSVMFWGCIGYKQIGPLIEVKNILNADSYISQILEPVSKTFWKKSRRGNRMLTFMQDNAPSHTAKVVKSWFGQKKINVMNWPPQSPDLNIIESLWDILLRLVRKQENQPSTLAQLKEDLIGQWSNLAVEQINLLYESLPKRMDDLRKAKGYPTKY